MTFLCMKNRVFPLLLMMIFLCLQSFSAFSFEFQVGGAQGWVVPPANDTKMYNDWASENRFQPGDTVRFRYKKDSVMEVSEAEYKKCNSTHPNFFSNTGNTVFNLNHSGLFFFISGVSGHCNKGQRMIVKVMAAEESSSSSSSPSGSKSSGSPAAAAFSLGVSKLVFVQFVLCYAASAFF